MLRTSAISGVLDQQDQDEDQVSTRQVRQRQARPQASPPFSQSREPQIRIRSPLSVWSRQGASPAHGWTLHRAGNGLNTDVLRAERFWRRCLREWFPRLHSQTYFLPPLHFNKVPYEVEMVAGEVVLLPKEASDQPFKAVDFPPIMKTSKLRRPSLPDSDHLLKTVDSPPRRGIPVFRRPSLPSVVWPDDAVPSGSLTRVYDMDVREDLAIQRVLDLLRDLGERQGEVMLVITHLEFRKYLDNEINPVTAAAIRLLPRPAALDSADPAGKQDRKRSSNRQGRRSTRKQPNLHAGLQGDFDILIINEKYGFIVGEIKAVGADLSKTPDLKQAILKAVEKAIKQLNKHEYVLRYLVSDLAPVRVTKTLIVPNISSSQLLNALSNNPDVQKALCQCLGVAADDVTSAVGRCLCEEDVSDPASSVWWQRTTTDHGPDSNMTPELYEILGARFCGPATTVEVPTVITPRRSVGLRPLSDAVALTGLSMAILTLYPQQVGLINRRDLRRVFLWGPPGTGKTVVLVLKGLQWLKQGKNIHLLSSHKDSRAAISLIEHQLQHCIDTGFASVPASDSRGETTESRESPTLNSETVTVTPKPPFEPPQSPSSETAEASLSTPSTAVETPPKTPANSVEPVTFVFGSLLEALSSKSGAPAETATTACERLAETSQSLNTTIDASQSAPSAQIVTPPGPSVVATPGISTKATSETSTATAATPEIPVMATLRTPTVISIFGTSSGMATLETSNAMAAPEACSAVTPPPTETAGVSSAKAENIPDVGHASPRHKKLVRLHSSQRLWSFLRKNLSNAMSRARHGPKIYTHFFDFEHNDGDVNAAVEKLAAASRDGELFLIVDEAYSGRHDTSGRFAEFCSRLNARVPRLHLWAAGVQCSIIPIFLHKELLSIPVRCPPAVIREVSKSKWFEENGQVQGYTSIPAPSPTDGPRVRWLPHWKETSDKRHSAPMPFHIFDLPENCEQCGENIAKLIGELGVGKTGLHVHDTNLHHMDLEYRDILILCGNPRENLPIVHSLRVKSLPVQVVSLHDSDSAIRDVALASHDAITVTHWKVVSGLERRVVVVMWSQPDDFYEDLYAPSRCTSLLVCLKLPKL